ncbi:hypothetical protein CHARACLAT_026839 [Characodon lateralis]|uniref:Uncharacterized protein n=1 Tax=Characodon lateralis TaxID=208331 RepID=A0ABU7F071_9TELE|nr:hypothetical protein [Characodon lateralis]
MCFVDLEEAFRDYVSRLAWERHGLPLEELEEVSVERDVWVSLLLVGIIVYRFILYFPLSYLTFITFHVVCVRKHVMSCLQARIKGGAGKEAVTVEDVIKMVVDCAEQRTHRS